MHYKDHCKDCQEKMGKAWEAVHRWLDEFAYGGSGMFRPEHRRVRHHKAGVEQVRKMWGDEAAKAAELHVLADVGRIPEDWEYEMDGRVSAL